MDGVRQRSPKRDRYSASPASRRRRLSWIVALLAFAAAGVGVLRWAAEGIFYWRVAAVGHDGLEAHGAKSARFASEAERAG